MRKIILGFTAAAFVFTSFAANPLPETVIHEGPSQDDLQFALEGMGLAFHSFRLPLDTLRPYNAVFILDEYENGELKNTTSQWLVPTHQQLIYQGRTEISYRTWNRISVIFNASGIGGKDWVHFNISGAMSAKLPLELDKGEKNFYSSRPFEPQAIITGVKIPLVLYGESWYDEKYKVHRFCGSTVVDAGMEDELFELSPHYYVVSLRFTENNDGLLDLNKSN